MRNKYGARKTEVNGIVFDSGAEANYYKQLLEQKGSGQIKDFELQPKFLLQPGFMKDDKWIRPVYYIADFKVINNDDSIIYIDVKGVETAVFKIKYKLFLEKYPDLTLQIVKAKGGATNDRKRPQTAEEKEKAKQRAERKKKSRERRNIRKRV